ncbi:hypothetical protein [Methylomonas sp. AM2-LC]|uniref:hypothetical protein n=1 Tax=Methylomonas sp. AM2-LC TaxID=3153301 RepID=UPI003263E9E8
MNNTTLEVLLNNLDGSGSDIEINAIRELRKLVGSGLPALLLNKYRVSKKWQVRSSCVYHSICYARDVEESVQLGIEALSDKSKVVRYRACMLLACSLNKNAISVLKELELLASDSETQANAHAAIDAIENQNTNYFVDRNHTGKVKLNFQ